MAASNRRDLFLQVGANIDNFTAAMKAGRSVLAQFGTAANDTTAEVQKAFEKLGGGSIQASAKAMDAAYAKTFRSIQANAQALTSATSGGAALEILNASAARQAAESATARASAARLVADAALRSADATKGDTAAARTYAAAMTAAALAAEEEATALRAQAGVLGGVERQLRSAGAAEDELGHAHSRMGASGLIAGHVVRSFTDSIAAGQSPVRAFTMELGRISEAMTFYAQETKATTGIVGKLAGFLTSGWGIAASFAVAALTPLIGKLFDVGDAAEKAKKAEEDYGRFQQDLGNFIDSTNGKLRERLRLMAEIDAKGALPDAELAKRQEEHSYGSQAFDAARAIADPFRYGSVVVRTGLSQAVADGADPASFRNASAQRAIDTSGGDPRKLALGMLDVARADPKLRQSVAEITKFAGMASLAYDEAERLKGKAAELSASLRGVPIKTPETVRDEEEMRFAPTATKRAGAHKRLVEHDGDELKDMPYGPKKLAALEAYRLKLRAVIAEVARAQEIDKAASQASRDDQQHGRTIGLSQAEEIVRGIGGRITSSTRSYQEQAALYARYKAGAGSLAAKPGTSEHERGEALDIAKAPGMSLARIVEAFRARGVNLSERLDEGDHYHVAWGKKGPSADALARREQAGVVRETNDDRAYQGELAQAQGRLAKAMLIRADTAEARYAIDIDDLRFAKGQRDLEIADQLKAGKFGSADSADAQAKATRLTKLNADAEALDEIAAKRREQDAVLDRKLGIERDDLTGQITLLGLQGNLALSLKERQRIALQTIDIEERIARATLATAIAKENDPEKKKALERQLGDVGPTADYRREEARRQNGGPMESYRLQLQGQVGNINEALEGVQVGAIQRLGDSFEGAVAKALHLHGALGDIVGDLLKVAEQKAIFSLLGGAGGSGGGFLSFFGIGKHADGGPIRGPGGPRDDRILARLSAGEYVINAAAYARNPRLVEAINLGRLPRFADGGLVGALPALPSLPSPASLARRGSGAPITFDMRGAVVTQDLLNQMNVISAQHAQAAVIGGAHMAEQNIAERQAQALA